MAKQAKPTRKALSSETEAGANVAPFRINVLGLAEAARQSPDTPVVATDIFHLSKQKAHLIFPVDLALYKWVFIIHTSLFYSEIKEPMRIELFDKNDNLLLWSDIQMSGSGITTIPFRIKREEDKPSNEKLLGFISKDEQGDSWFFGYSECKGFVYEPGSYPIKLHIGDKLCDGGTMDFFYTPVPPLSPEKIKAINSDPNAAKFVSIRMRCEKCHKAFKAYSGLRKYEDVEKDGYVSQYEIKEEEFLCDCGELGFNLKYIKENLHSLIGRDAQSYNVDVARRSGHKAVVETVSEYNSVLKRAKKESELQEFIEEHPVMLSMFHAQKLFGQTDIIGKFKTDFIIHDVRGQLLFIEIENPNTPLFNKRSGHISGKLSHAYSQILDWLHEYDKHRGAILERLTIEQKDISRVKGVVIAGRTANTNQEHLQKHLVSPSYPTIDLYTYDDLARELVVISKGLRLLKNSWREA